MPDVIVRSCLVFVVSAVVVLIADISAEDYVLVFAWFFLLVVFSGALVSEVGSLVRCSAGVGALEFFVVLSSDASLLIMDVAEDVVLGP